MPTTDLRPGEFTRLMLKALEASEGRTRSRKRDQKPDTIGLGIRRELLQRATEADPDPDAFEVWLMEQVVASPAAGPVRAMAVQILDEYRFARHDPTFETWLRDGAPSDDADPASPRNAGRSLPERW